MYVLPKADVTLFLDLPVQLSQQLVRRKAPRQYTNAVRDLHEKNASYLENWRKVYRALTGAQHRSWWLVIDCISDQGMLMSREQIHASIWNALLPYVGLIVEN